MLKKAKEIYDELVDIRRDLHKIPEVGLDLPQTTEYVMEKLKEFGYEPTRIIDSGVVATVGKPGAKVLLLRADMDGLPMEETSGEEFASTNGCMHACGHDFHTTMLLGAAKLLKEMEDHLTGMVKFMFQPAEEVFLGAKAMIEAGVMENPKVDAAFSMHVSSDFGPEEFAYNDGPSMASSDNFEIIIKGAGSHGATPHSGKDPINVAVKIHEALQSVIARQVDASELNVLTIGQLIAGTAPNIIPEEAILRGTIRSFHKPSRDIMYNSMHKIANNIAEAFDCQVVINDLANVPVFVNDKEMANLFIETLNDLGFRGEEVPKRRALGSEDFACVAELVPAAFGNIGIGVEDESKRHPLHRPSIIFDERALPIGTAIFLQYTMNYFKNN